MDRKEVKERKKERESITSSSNHLEHSIKKEEINELRNERKENQ